MAVEGLRFCSYLLFVSLLSILSAALSNPHIRALSTEEDVNIPPAGVIIDGITTLGHGCDPAFTWSEVDETMVATVHLPRSQLEFGPGIHANLTRVHCNVGFSIWKPKGWTYGVQSIDVTGYFKLDEGVRARIQGDYYFSSGPSSSNHGTVVGPFPHSLHTYRVEFPLWHRALAMCSEGSRVTTQTAIRLMDIDVGNSTGGSGSIGIPRHVSI
ncbi:hypothetical protein CC1G_13615 [Coprinopsis cinerea okayama7|uniref:Secreted protein n=1 Tax=Coprinopsis cinerea (strain Okayama-7 / 130 / ATCC MYA-4618 / FGSC 9003) TaxID=240176 RepID=D6RJX0_COPC7|nr:hypothetical protein CC1G_13615 [Coprinopsis cinerea okayama7\|eukprot:XP_002912082.1 hypothetical protein CC1G_13615 [Coprinopsis cinerea okayama7\